MMAARPMPAPVGGLNLRDGLAEMKSTDALVLSNWFPEASYLRLRGGYESQATGIGGAVRSLLEWAGPSSRKLFAASASAVYDVTSAGAVGAASLSGLTSGAWQSVQFTTAGGSFLVACNGADDVRNYDGTTWTAPTISGVTSSSLINVASHKSRLWFVEKSSTRAWYLGTSSISGTATSFELGERFTRGGSLRAIGTVSTDASQTGTDDYLCFISSAGEVVIYRGTDPSSGSTWSLAGVYRIATPIGSRCVRKIGGDLAVLTEAGVVSMRQIIAYGQEASAKSAITFKIDRGIAEAFQAYGNNTGWELAVHPRTRQAIVNVPTSSSQAFQYAMNIQTGAWCSYSGLNATCWGTLNEELYFGDSSGRVWHAERGNADNGAAITGEVKTSFQSLGRGRLVRFSHIRPQFLASAHIVPAVRVNVDYANDTPIITDQYPISGAAGDTWDSGLWGTAVWGDNDAPSADWIDVDAEGTTASIHLLTRTNGVQAKLISFDTQHEIAREMAL